MMGFNLVKTLIQKPLWLIDFSGEAFFQYFLIDDSMGKGDWLAFEKGKYMNSYRIVHAIDYYKPQMKLITLS